MPLSQGIIRGREETTAVPTLAATKEEAVHSFVYNQSDTTTADSRPTAQIISESVQLDISQSLVSFCPPAYTIPVSTTTLAQQLLIICISGKEVWR